MAAGRERGARGLGYRVFGPRFDYLLHMRPVEWPIMAAHTLLGWVLAVGVAGAAGGDSLGPVALGLLAWVVCLNGGTLAINSAFDQDEGDIAYLRRPPPPPKYLFAFGLAAMIAGQVMAFLLPAGFVVAYAVCFVLSVLYSVPPFRLKAVAGADWLINMWGFGTLTPYAGWAATGIAVPVPLAIVMLAFCPLFASLYPLTQLYQLEEDARRGDRTLAIRLGRARSLDVAIGAALIAFGAFAVAGVLSGWGPDVDGLRRWAALAAALALWLAVLIPWRIRHGRMAPADDQGGMYRALGAWAATDLAVAFAWGT